MPQPIAVLVRVLAVAVIGALSWKLLHVDARGPAGVAVATTELAALVVALVWPGRVTTTAAVALPAAIAIASHELLLQTAWMMWALTVIGLASLARSVAARSQLPDARAR